MGLQKGRKWSTAFSFFIPLDSRREALYAHELKLEVVFSQPRTDPSGSEAEDRGGKVHYEGTKEMPGPTDLEPTVAQGQLSLKAGAAGAAQTCAGPWALGPLSRWQGSDKESSSASRSSSVRTWRPRRATEWYSAPGLVANHHGLVTEACGGRQEACGQAETEQDSTFRRTGRTN